MAKKKTARRTHSFTIPVAVIAGLAPGAYRAYEGFSTDGIRGLAYRLSNDFTGFDPYQKKFNLFEMKYGLGPLLLGVAVHKVAGKLGINRALGRAGVPFLRV